MSADAVHDASTYQVGLDIGDELHKAREKWPPIASLHEGYAIILEEVEELWEQVKLKPDLRDPEAMREELVQIAAMAIRTAVDCGLA